MSLNQFIAVIRARWMVVALVFSLIAGAAIAYVLLAPRKYTATASLVLNVHSADPVAERNGGSPYQQTSASYMATQVDVLMSERVARRALASLESNPDPQVQSVVARRKAARDIKDGDILSVLLTGLLVLPSPDSSALSVNLSDRDPEFAAAAANAIVRGYMDTSVDLRLEPAKEYSSFFSERTKQAREELENAQARLSEYQQRHGLLSTDEKLDVENGRLATLSNQLVEAEAALVDAANRARQAQSHAGETSESLSSGVVSAIKTELAQRQAQMGELTARLGEMHPQVVQLRSSIAQLERRMSEENRRISGSMESNKAVATGRVNELRTALDMQRRHLLALKARRDEAAVLERDVENARRSFDAISQKLNQTQIESQSSLTNVNILKAAAVPKAPSSPKVLAVLTLGSVFAAVAALGLAWLLEVFDRRMRTEDDVRVLLRQPMLGVMPGTDGLRQIAQGGASSARALLKRARALPELRAPSTR